MKILVISLEGIDPSSLFVNENLKNLRRLMEMGVYGWMEASEDQPGSMLEKAMRAHCSRLEKSFILANIPFSPTSDQILAKNKDRFSSEIITMSGLHFEAARKLVQKGDWDYFQIVEMGLEPISLAVKSSAGAFAVAENLEGLDEGFLNAYAQHLDDEVGNLLESLSDDTVVMVLDSREQEQQVNSGERKRSWEGAFILASANNPLHGEIQGVRMFDLLPTLLELGEFEPISEYSGRSILAGLTENFDSALAEEEEALLREQLRGLGYI